MKKFLITILSFIFKKNPMQDYLVIKNPEVYSASTYIAITSFQRAERERRFERAFQKYLECSEMISAYPYAELRLYSEENLKALYHYYSDEAIELLPDGFVEEIEKLKLQIQAK